MGLKKEVHVKISGTYLQGAIVGQNYKTNDLISVNRVSKGSGNFNTHTLKKIIEELQELVDTMESLDVANTLSEDDKDPLSHF